MKLIATITSGISLLLIFTSLTAQAAFTACQYQTQPCDQFGNHFYCTSVGWIGPNTPEYCSPIDHGHSSSSGQNINPPPASHDSCVETCGRPCTAAPAFCGSW